MNKRKRVAMLKHRKRRIKLEAKNKALTGSVEEIRKVSKMRPVARESINLLGQREKLSGSATSVDDTVSTSRNQSQGQKATKKSSPKSRTSSASAGKTSAKKVPKKVSPTKKVAKSKKLESSADKPKTRTKKNSD